MTVRELINALLAFDADETIDFALNDKDIIIKEFGHYADLPYIIFTEDEDEQSSFLLPCFFVRVTYENTIFQVC